MNLYIATVCSINYKVTMIYSTDSVAKVKPDKIDELIVLRAQGLSTGKIAKQLHLAKATVCEAVKIFEADIKNEEFNIAEEIKEKYKMARRYRLERLMKQLKKVYDEID